MAAYNDYKTTQTLGFDSIPYDWDIKKVKYLFSIGRGRVIAQEELMVDGLYPVYSSQTQNNGCLGYINSFDFDCDQLTWTTDGANAGTIFIRSGKHNCTNVCGTLQLKSSLTSLNFIYYALQYAAQFYKRPDTNGAKIMNNEMAEIGLATPSILEQQKIIEFLDHETAQIDTLIEKQQTLIQLLKEKRQAVISHAVTKGLNPDAPMKDSGVEWLGEVPEHWVRASIKNLCYVNDGNHGEEYPSEVDFVEKGEGVPFIRGGDFDDFRIVSNNLRYISHEKNKSMRKGRLQENDILFVNRGATIGKLCIIDKDYVGSNLNSQIAYLRADKTQIDFRYLTYFLSSSYTQTKIISSIYGGALPQYSIQNIINLDVWYGSVEEQSMIADYLDKQVKVITYLIGKAERAIELLQERRTALISAAVTGKIDVRDWRVPE